MSLKLIRTAGIFLLPVVAAAQSPSAKTLNLVAPQGSGRIFYTADPDSKILVFKLLDNDARLLFETTNPTSRVSTSYSVFPNQSGSPTAESCRDFTTQRDLTSLTQHSGSFENDRKATYKTPSGTTIAIRSALITKMYNHTLRNQEIYAFLGDAATCAKLTISKPVDNYQDNNQFAPQLDNFQFEASYKPTAQDYFNLGSIFYRVTKSYKSAATYYQRALDTLPPTTSLSDRRVLADQLAMSYGLSGQIEQSRAVNEEAIRTDPEYPLYYYNLACADAEQGDTQNARVHLQQAFDRRANTLLGEKLPDPTKDDSILKLKKDKTFWAFVESLSKNK